jgi:lipid II:glycine glycyltransferase (peptidoglycan interpeptide bridge formation enzyme)
MTSPSYHTTSFLQSPDWENFKRTIGHTPLRVDDVLVLTHKLIGPLKYAFVPRATVTDAVLDVLADQGFLFARIEGVVETKKNYKETKHRLPQTTLMLDLTQSEEELLSNMHSKTRYNIRLAERKGVTVRTDKHIDTFWNLNLETRERDGFQSHDKEYYRVFIDMPMCTQYTAYVDDTPIAAILCVSYAGTTTYVHGASSNTYRNTMAPYLLQWRALQDAKQRQDSTYDFWGIAPPFTQQTGTRETCYNGFSWDISHPWTGITRFKVGFGGQVVSYPKSVDVILKPLWYRIYSYIHRIRYGRT